MVRVRFAPSPTGNLHIGGARTALFNWLYAQAKKGQFILRIEDTDVSRSKKEYVDEILGSLNWLGFSWDEIYYQSQRLDLYQEYADKLLKEKKAYSVSQLAAEPTNHLSCLTGQPLDWQTDRKLDQQTNAIIFKIIPQKIKINDLIHGEIEFDTSVIKDQVLIKSDGMPTYNFACVVDDALTKISHVIRGDDHISNTPKQILLYQALGFPIPEFAHLPLILAKEGGRMSKRKGAIAISEYRQMGYLPGALVNFFMLLGWSIGENREIIDIKEAIKLFDIKNINKTASLMDMDKLDWINSQYLKNEDPHRLTDEIIPLLIEKKFIDKDNFDRNYVFSLVKLFQTRLTVLKDFVERADSFFLKDIKIDPVAKEKFLSQDLSKEFKLFMERIENLEKFDVQTIEMCFRNLVRELGIEARMLIHPIRVALTGKTIGPGLFELIYYLGKERIKERLMKWVK